MSQPDTVIYAHCLVVNLGLALDFLLFLMNNIFSSWLA
jgi:hypothetical protein